MVAKASNGEIGYLHIRAMDAPSLRRFQLDLAANRTKKALVIDQRFNGGGGIDQELLGILAGRRYQYTQGRDAGFQQPRPQNFYGPMVVMQNERSASDAEMFPAGFKAARPRQDGRRADDGRGDRDRFAARCSTASTIRTPGQRRVDRRPARTWRTTACRRMSTSTTRRPSSSRAATRSSRRRWKC